MNNSGNPNTNMPTRPTGVHPYPGLQSDGNGGIVGSGQPQPTTPSLLPPPSSSAGGASPFKPQVKWLSIWAATVTVVGAGVLTVKLAGDDNPITVPLETSTAAVGKAVRIGFGDGGRCAVVAVLGGF